MHLLKPADCVRSEKGFTIIQLIVVMAIIAIIAAIAIPVYFNVVEDAKQKVLVANTSEVAKLTAVYCYDYDQEDWYDSWNHDGDGSLNNFLELELEIINDGTYENNISLKNPYSEKMSILDYDKTLSSGDGFCPAVFLTANSAYSPAGGGSTDNILGTIVIYFKLNGGVTEYIQVYYVNNDGTKSEDVIRVG